MLFYLLTFYSGIFRLQGHCHYRHDDGLCEWLHWSSVIFWM